jgi:hypothetical protein
MAAVCAVHAELRAPFRAGIARGAAVDGVLLLEVLLVSLLLAGVGCSGWLLLLTVLVLAPVVLVLVSFETFRRVDCLRDVHAVRALQGVRTMVSATAAAVPGIQASRRC